MACPITQGGHKYRNTLITFCMSRRPREMYCGHPRLCVCVYVCVSVRGRMPTLLHGPGCNLGEWKGIPLVVHYWADWCTGARVVLLWHHYGNAWQSPAVIRQAHRTPYACRTLTLRMPAKTALAGDKIDERAACAVPFRPYCGML